jgi:pimeloyl-ACP methyl ester carboxylesterase
MYAVDDGRGSPVLLLHGQPGGRHDWDAVAARLVVDHRVIVPDRPGYGRTGGAAMGIKANADACVALLDHLEVDRATIAGHSWGGGVALAMAQRHPDRVSGLVLVASIGGASSLRPFDRVLAAPIAGDVLAWVGFRVVGRRLRSRRLQSAAAAVKPGMPHVVAAVGEWRSSAVWRSFVIEQRAMVAEMPALTAGLGSVRAPTTVLVGERDAVMPRAAADELARAIPLARLERIARHGHLLPIERPDEVAAAIALRAAAA